MNTDIPTGPTAKDWANANLGLKKISISDDPEETIYELRKTLVINGVAHLQFVWLNQKQLRSVGLEYGL